MAVSSAMRSRMRWASAGTPTIPEFHWGKLLDAKDREIDRLNQIYIGMLEKAGVTLFEGFGRLIDRHTVEVAGRRYTAENHPDRGRRPSA